MTEATLNLPAGEQNGVTEFAFHNAGSKPVAFLSLDPSCDCVTAKPNKPIVAPGESGVIRVTFAVGGHEGRNEKSVNVVTDDAPSVPQRLSLVVDLAEPVAIHPRAVFWKTGEAVVAKGLEIILAEPSKTKLGDVQCAQDIFRAVIVPLKELGRYRLQITPSSTNQLVQATIRLNAIVGGTPRVYIISAGVN